MRGACPRTSPQGLVRSDLGAFGPNACRLDFQVSRETANAVLPVISAIPLTTRKPQRRIYPNEALIPKGQAGLKRDSIAMAHELRTLSKTRLGRHIGHLEDSGVRDEVRSAMRTQLDLD